ncbi:MAG TPA: TIGR00282 family metallophosphoesterase [Candidatus Ozemobacteraceae bacterium]|nr:TIGR00282 family metallophosphoesterase [Candidatus Ozemobacteraceae bacterium]
MMRVLMLGDIYGKPGRRAACELIPELRRRWSLDWVIANGENATGGAGLSPRHRNGLRAAGIDLLTSGNHIFARPDWPELLKSEDGNVLRPHNLGGDDRPGRGWALLGCGTPLAFGVINLAGRVFMEPGDCPFRTADRLLEKFPTGVPVLVDIHAEATSEKIALSWHLNGRVAAVVGSHTHVQTADERILSGGTAVITDLGMTGPRDGVLGVDRELVINRFYRGFSDKFHPAIGEVVLEGVVVEIGPDAKAVSIRRVREFGPVAVAADEGEN